MKRFAFIIIGIAIHFILFSTNTFSANLEEFTILEVSKNKIYCQILNPSLDCQLIENQISVIIRSNIKEMDADLDMVCGKMRISAYGITCNKTENIYICDFSLEPLLQLEKAEPLDCSMYFHFYKKFSNESIGSEKYEGSFMIMPIYEITLLSISKQKSKLFNDFAIVKNFDKEAVYTASMCSFVGKGMYFDKIERYEEELNKLGGVVISAKNSFERSLNLLTKSSELASSYVENGDPFFSKALEIFILRGLYTGSFMNNLIYYLDEGYISKETLENLKDDVDVSCEKIHYHFDYILNLNFLVMKKLKLIDCLEKRDFKNCWKKLAEMENYINPGNTPSRAELKFYIGNRLLKDNSNICKGSKIRIEKNQIDRYGIDHITIRGEGKNKVCENTIEMDFGVSEYDAEEFLCGSDNEPVDGKRYTIEVDPGAVGKKIEYSVNYYLDVENCKVQEQAIPV
jgi:hypothetical protein